MITRVKGVKVGHFTDREKATGCTVVLLPSGTVGGCEVRGGAPGTRELALLSPYKTVPEVHAVLLAGGSAFGLAAADGVMRFLKERGIGFKTQWGIVPIVPAAVVYDLYLGSPEAFPLAENGYQACEDAKEGFFEQGNVGAGMGAIVGKWAGLEYWMKGGLGSSSLLSGKLIAGALAVVNALGDVYNEDGTVLAGAINKEGKFLASFKKHGFPSGLSFFTNTTLLVVATNAKLTKLEANLLARRAQNALAQAIRPVHTSFDGDISFALATGEVDADFEFLAELTIEASKEAIRNAVRFAQCLPDVPACSGFKLD